MKSYVALLSLPAALILFDLLSGCSTPQPYCNGVAEVTVSPVGAVADHLTIAAGDQVQFTVTSGTRPTAVAPTQRFF